MIARAGSLTVSVAAAVASAASGRRAAVLRRGVAGLAAGRTAGSSAALERLLCEVVLR